MNAAAHRSLECIACHGALSEYAVFCSHCGKQQPDAVEQTDYEYAAFISYRHRPMDTNVAMEIQQAVESYRLPRGVKSPSVDNDSRALGKCFRDEDELAAATSLPESIRSALAKARTLIVVCTPETSQSAWIEREILAFFESHGRERVFAVLADGSSSESIPKVLRERVVVDIDGEPQIVPTEPLAADFRSQKASSRPQEKLRVISAIAGCGYDELRQRERERKRQQRTKRITVVVCLAVVIAVLGVFGFKSFRQAQTEESLKLALESQSRFSAGDRYGAIKVALQALPSSSAAIERPIVEEAQVALEDALEVNPSTQIWRASYSMAERDEIEQMLVSPQEGWVATMDGSLNVTVRDAITGSVLSRCSLDPGTRSSAENRAVDLQASNWKLEKSGPNIIVAERAGSGYLACFEARTGKLLWYEIDEQADAIVVSPDNKLVMVMQVRDDSIVLLRHNAATGLATKAISFDNPGFSRPEAFLPATMGETAGTIYAGIGTSVARLDCSSREMLTNENAGGEAVHSIRIAGEKYSDDEIRYTLVTASSTEYGSDSSASDYLVSDIRVAAFDTNLHPRWEYKTTQSLSVVGEAYGAVRIDDRPKIYDHSMTGKPAYIFSAGSTVFELSLDGELIYSEQFNSPVAGAGVGYYNDDSDIIFISLADGAVECRLPTSTAVTSGLSARLPAYVFESYVGWVADQTYVVIAQPAYASERIVSYRMDYKSASPDAERQEHSLDELISQAHELLDSVAQ